MRRIALLLMLSGTLLQAGCVFSGWLKPRPPFGKGSPCVLQPGASKEHIVAHLNSNIVGGEHSGGLASWRSTHVRLSLKGVPMALPASIAVEAPRNFRLRVSEPIGRGDMVDMGSNQTDFWFWAKDAQPRNVITASHEQLPYVQQQMQIPCQPDWLMEVLGVIPIDASEVTLRHPDPSSPLVELVSTHMSPAGQKITKVIRVDSCHGIVREHALHDSRGVIIARAALADHRVDPTSQLTIPHTIQIDWPEMDQQLTMRLEHVEINPPPMPAQAWMIPVKPGYPTVDIVQLIGGTTPMAGPQLRGGVVPINPFSDESDEVLKPEESPFSDSPTADVRPSAYSSEAGQSSSVPPPRARALWPRPPR